MKRGLLLAALAALAALAVLTVLAADLPTPASQVAAQAPSSADPSQIVRIHSGIYLYWHEPASGGGITGYDIQHRSGTSGNWNTWTDASFSGTTQPAVVTGLTAGTTYQFRVRAENASGKGAWSEAPDSDDDPARVVTIAASASGVPNTVMSVAAAAGDGRIAVTWMAPHARTGVTVTGFTVFWRYYDDDDASNLDSAPSIAVTASSYTITGLLNGRPYDIWLRAQASGKRSRDSVLVYDVTPTGSGSGTTPTPTPIATPAATPTPTPKPGPRVLGGIAPRGGGAVTVAPGATVRLDLDFVDGDGEAVSLDALPRVPVIGWYIPLQVYANARQDEARVRVVFEQSLPDRHPTAPLATVAGEPGSVLYSAPADALGQVVVRAVTAASDCPGGGGGTDRYAAAAWDGPCSAEFTITIPPAVTIAAVSEAVSEGENAAFTVSRTGATTSALTVSVNVGEAGDTLDGTPPASVTIPVGASSATLDIPTEDDQVREIDSVVTATLTAPAGYVAGPSGSAAVTVEDDDPLPATTLRYDTYDLTGAVTKPGSYAFLMPDDDGDGMSVATTYEQLRTESTALRFNLTDADGTSRAGFYRVIEPGDLVEWRQADDCWARYMVTSRPTTVSGTATNEFEVKAFTDSYAGCSGTVVANGVRRIGWAPPAISSRALTAPVRHGLNHLIPAGWLGPIAGAPIAPVPDHVAAIRDYRGGPHPLWRPAEVPQGWSLAGVFWGGETDPAYGYTAWYRNEHGEAGVEILVGYWAGEQYPYPLLVYRDTTWEREPRIIDGHHAIVQYSPLGAKHEPRRLPRVELFNAETRIFYLVIAWDPRLAGADPTATIEIARSLIRPAEASAR